MTSGATPFASLRRFVAEKPPAGPVEHCELCNLGLGARHRHLLERQSGRVCCACDACALLFHDVTDGRFSLIPRDTRSLDGFRISDEQWLTLSLPIDLAFFRYSSAARVVAMYPSPAGVTVSQLPLDAWQTLVAENPVLARLTPDVEALLVNRVGTARQYFIAPIDACYELAGLIRTHWRGFSGGPEVRAEIDRFFQQLDRKSRRLS